MKTLFTGLEYGEEKTVKVSGTYLKAVARAVHGSTSIAAAELLIMSDGSSEDSKIRIVYADYGSMDEFVFFEIDEYVHNNENLVDIIPFNYVSVDNILKTGVILVEKTQQTTTSK